MYGTPLEDMPCGGYESPGAKGEAGALVASNGGTGGTGAMDPFKGKAINQSITIDP